MDGLIAEKGKTKLIFFAVDDDSLLPTRKEIRDHFPECSYNIYKAWGHFRSSVDSIEAIFRIRRLGIASSRSWSNDRIITHIYRIDTSKGPDSFFTLKYSASLVGFYEISRDDMFEIKTLTDYAHKQYDLMSKMNDYVDRFESGAKLASFLNVQDMTMSNPDQESIVKLFSNYGESAEEQIIEKINQFIEKIKWQ
jgi:hypothetical protein